MCGGITPFLRSLLLVAMMALVAISGASILGDVGPDADNDGIPDAVEVTEGTNPAVKDNDVFASSRLLVMQVYRDFLGREADAGGLAYWQGQLDAGMAPEAFIDQVQGQPEFQARVAPVIRLYLTAFNRRPDHDGLTYWTRQFAAGMSLEAIATSFAGSAEFLATYGALTNRQYIETLYLNTLQRPGDVRGVDHWTAQLDNSVVTRGQMLAIFSESPENVVTSTAEVLVAMSYAGMLNRTADIDGYNFWVDRVTLAFDRQGLIRAFYVSPEYHNRFLPAPTPPTITSADATTFYVGAPGTFTVTATGVPAPTFAVSGALPAGVTFNGATGVLSGTPAAGTAGTYVIAFTAGNGNAPDATQGFTLTVSPAVAITSAAATTFTVGTAGTFTVTTSSTPVAGTITHAGALPSGVTFVNNGNGTATLAGTPAAGTGGAYPITITAANGVTANGVQNFVLTVNQAPAITSANAATFALGAAGTHTVTATGFPVPTLSVTGSMPPGVTFNPATGALSGTPTAGGSYPLVFTAANGVGSNATQNFTLTVNQAPAITSPDAVAFTVGAAGTFTPATTGFPVPSVGMTGALPGGVTFAAGVLSGTPDPGTGGTYPLTFTASNGVGANAVQNFTLTVNQAPAITSLNVASFSLGLPGTFTVTATGFPAPTFATAGPLPSGVTLSAAGLLSGTPTAAGTFNFSITASNGVTPADTQLFMLTVTDSAVANDDAYSTVHDTTLTVPAPGVLGNDSGTPPLTVTAVNGVPANVGIGVPTSHGGVTVNADGSFSYIPTPGYAGTDVFTYVAQNANGSDTATVTITVTNVAPVVDLDGALSGGIGFGPVSFTEDGAPLAIVGTANPNWLTITDADGPTIASAAIVLTNLQDAGSETLALACPQGPAPACSGAIQTTDIVATAAPATYTIAITRPAPFADYEALLRTLTYANSSQNPTTTPDRIVTVTVNDGIAPSSPVAQATVTLNAANDAPVLAAIEAGTLAYGIGAPPAPVTATLTVADVDSANLAGATAQIIANCANADDVLVFAPQNGISGNYAPATCTMTLTGSSSVANYQAALRDVRFQNNNAATSLLIRTVRFQANDGGVAANLSNPVTRDVTLSTNGAPVLGAGATLNYTEAQPPAAIDGTVTVTDADGASLVGATIQITGNCLGTEDVLSFATQNGITGVYSAGTCLMTLSGTATLANYQVALRSVQYSNTSAAPSTLVRTVTWQGNDGGAINNLSNTPTSTINVAAVNSAPVVTAGGTAVYAENDPAVPVAAALTVTDADSTDLAGATVQITANCNAAQDVLAFVNQNGITGTYTAATCLMTLAGSSTVANYQAALRSITYANSSDNPTTAPRTVTWIANDGALPSAAATSTINVVAVNDAPVVTVDAGALPYVENAPAMVVSPTATVVDVDGDIASATVVISGGCVPAQDVLGMVGPIGGIASSYAPATCTLTLTGNATPATYQLALRLVTYFNSSDNPTGATRVAGFQVNDGQALNNLSTTVTRTINITAVNDAPTATAFANLPAQAGIPITYPAGKLGGTDPEGTALTIDTTPINVTNGTVTLAADGGFTFTPFSGAATASFQYRVVDSGTPAPNQPSGYVTVGFTVSGPNIYFVKNSPAGLNNCTLGNECQFASAITSIGASTNAIIFIGDDQAHTAGSALNAGAQVIGQGVSTAQTFDQFFVIGAPAQGILAPRPSFNLPRPTVAAAAAATLTLGSNNTLRGFDVTNGLVAGVAIAGTGFGTLTASDMLLNTTGGALSLTTGTANVTFDSVTSSGGTNNVNLNGVAGTLSLGGGGLSGATGNAFNVAGGTGSITYGGTIASGTARSVSVAGRTGGTVTFNGAITDSDTGISLTGNGGATIVFNGQLTLSTGTNAAFAATGGGTVIAPNAANTIATTTGTALNVTNTTIGAGGLNFVSINSSGGTGNGIILDNTGSTAGLTVTGDGTSTSVGGNGSGGTIANKGGTDLNFTNGIGIYLNNTKNVVLRRMIVNGTNQNFGIRGTLVDGFTLEYSMVNGVQGTAATLAAPENAGEGAIYFGNTTTNGITTAGTFTSNVIGGGRARNLSIINTAGTLVVTIKGNNFQLNQNFSDAGAALLVEARGGTVTANLGGTLAGEPNSFEGAPGDNVNFTGQTGSTMTVTMRNNILANSHTQNIIGGGGLTLATQGTMNFIVDGNSINGANGSAVTLFKAVAATLMSGIVNNNTIGTNVFAGSGSATGNGIFVSAGGTGTMSYTITNNTIVRYNGNAAIYADNTGGSYTANFTVTGNTAGIPGPGAFAGLAITNGSPGSGDTVQVCADIRNNDFSTGDPANANDIIVGASGAAAGHVFNLPGYGGGANLANVQNFIRNNNLNSGTTAVSAYFDPPATAAAFTGTGSTCPTP